MYTKSGSSTSAPMRTNPNKNIHTSQTMYTMYTPTEKRQYFGLFCCVHYFFSMYTHVHSVHTNVHTGEEKAVAVYILGCCVHFRTGMCIVRCTQTNQRHTPHIKQAKNAENTLFFAICISKSDRSQALYFIRKSGRCVHFGAGVYMCVHPFFSMYTPKNADISGFFGCCVHCVHFSLLVKIKSYRKGTP